MVERIRITPSQIITRDASNNITFSTDYSYLKTGSGTLYVGGYQRAPAIYGQNSISDHTEDGWYTMSMKRGNFLAQYSNLHPWEVPKATTTQYRHLETGTAYGNSTYNNFAAGFRTMQYLNYDTNQRSNTNIIYIWSLAQIGYDPDSDGNYTRVEWQLYPIFNTFNFPAPTNPSGGRFELQYYGNEHLGFYYTNSGYDEYGNAYSYTRYAWEVVGERTASDGYGSTYTIPATPINWRANAIFSLRDPIALSLAVTA